MKLKVDFMKAPVPEIRLWVMQIILDGKETYLRATSGSLRTWVSGWKWTELQLGSACHRRPLPTPLHLLIIGRSKLSWHHPRHYEHQHDAIYGSLQEALRRGEDHRWHAHLFNPFDFLLGIISFVVLLLFISLIIMAFLGGSSEDLDLWRRMIIGDIVHISSFVHHHCPHQPHLHRPDIYDSFWGSAEDLDL